MAAESGTHKTQSSSSTAVQLTTGTTGANSPNVTSTDKSKINLGTAFETNKGDIFSSTTDFNAVDKAFEFGDSIALALAEVVAGTADANAQTQNANTAFLNSVLDDYSAQTDAGQAATSQKTLLYAVGGVVLLLALFIWKR